MATDLTVKALERGTYIINAAFTDEDGGPVVPTALTWSLLDDYGAIINSRLDVSITPAASVDIVLSGDDLALVGDSNPRRVLLVEGTYDSSLGSDLPLKDQARFEIANLTGLSG